jgi:hypothetical protein
MPAPPQNAPPNSCSLMANHPAQSPCSSPQILPLSPRPSQRIRCTRKPCCKPCAACLQQREWRKLLHNFRSYPQLARRTKTHRKWLRKCLESEALMSIKNTSLAPQPCSASECWRGVRAVRVWAMRARCERDAAHNCCCSTSIKFHRTALY